MGKGEESLAVLHGSRKASLRGWYLSRGLKEMRKNISWCRELQVQRP